MMACVKPPITEPMVFHRRRRRTWPGTATLPPWVILIISPPQTPIFCRSFQHQCGKARSRVASLFLHAVQSVPSVFSPVFSSVLNMEGTYLGGWESCQPAFFLGQPIAGLGKRKFRQIPAFFWSKKAKWPSLRVFGFHLQNLAEKIPTWPAGF